MALYHTKHRTTLHAFTTAKNVLFTVMLIGLNSNTRIVACANFINEKKYTGKSKFTDLEQQARHFTVH